jgi:MFS family permease
MRTGLPSFLRSPASERHSLRIFYFLTLVDSAGTGLFLSGSVLFLVRGVGLSAQQVGTGMGFAGLAGFLAAVPLGIIASRSGARRMLIELQLWRAVCYLLYAFVTNFWSFLLLACLAGMAERADPPLTQAVLGEITGSEARGRAYVQVRRLRNVGYGVGTAFSALAAFHDSIFGYQLLLLGNSLSFVIAAALLAKVPSNATAVPPAGRPALRGSRALKDIRYLRLTGVNVLLSLHMTMMTVAIPLWILEHTGAPHSVVQLAFGLNIVLVIICQGYCSRNADSEPGARRCLTWAAVGLALACGALALAGWAKDAFWAVGLLVLATVFVTLAEVWQTVGGWNLSYALAPESRRPEYLAVFSLSTAAQRIAGPPLVTLAIIPLGPAGWIIAMGVFAVFASQAGLLLGPMAKSQPRLASGDRTGAGNV